MKISKLHIRNHHQFKDLELDLTYPIGHEKEGQPLDKVCFIGQSGTGKTSLLEIVKDFALPTYFSDFVFYWMNQEDYLRKRNILLSSKESTILSVTNFQNIEYTSVIVPGIKSNGEETEILTNRSYGNFKLNGVLIQGDVEKNKEVAEIIELLNRQPLFGIYVPEGYEHIPNGGVNQTFLFLDFRYYNIKNIWNDLNETVRAFNAERTYKTAQLYKDTKDADSKIRDEKFKELKEWERLNPNPYQVIATEVLDKILTRLNLKINTDLTIDIIQGRLQIPVKNLVTNEDIPFDVLSSGAHHIIFPSLVLHFNKPENAIILFDEVENALYPNVEQEIIKHYTSLWPNNQFFFATHSPIIASSFDPWEIIELKFDKEGYVIQEQLFEGERHIDNYKFNPKYLRWDAILTDIFKLDEEGNPEREKLIQELARVNNKLKKLNGKPENEQIKSELLSEYQKIANKLRWKIDS